MGRLRQPSRWAILALALFAAGSRSFAAGPIAERFQRFSIEQGLPHTVVGDVAEDQPGFLWLATRNGLSRFDGYGFKTYQHRAFDPATIADSQVTAIQPTPSGVMWIGTMSGLDGFDPRTETFRHYPLEHALPSGPIVTTLLLDRSGSLWVGTEYDGLFRFDPETGSVQRYFRGSSQAEGLAGNSIKSLCQTRDGTLWVGIWESGLSRWDARTDTFHRYPFSYGKSKGMKVSPMAILEDPAGRLWVATTDDGVIEVDPGSGAFRVFRHRDRDPSSLSTDYTSALLWDQAGSLWVGTWGGGLDRLDPSTGAIEHHRALREDPERISGDYITALLQDSSGLLWVATYGAGLCKLDLAPQFVRNYRYRPSDGQGLSDPMVQAVYEDTRGELWIGTSNGLDRFDPASETYRRYRGETDGAGGLPDSNVLSLQGNASGVWAGTIGGLSRYLPRRDAFRPYCVDEHSPQCVGGFEVAVIASGLPAGILWIGSKEGMDRLDAETDRFRHYDVLSKSPAGAVGKRVTAIEPTEEGYVWVGSEGGGLRRLDPVGGAIRCYEHDPGRESSLSLNHVSALYRDPSGVLWVGTYGGGLDRFDAQTETFQHFGPADGLPSAIVYGILPDHEKKLWISTSKGLARLDPQSGEVATYDTGDGLLSDEFNRGACFKGSAGTLYFGCIRGLTAVSPQLLRPDEHIPSIAVTALRGYSRGTWTDVPLPASGDLDVPNGLEVLFFEFSALNFRAPAKNRYAYKLDGLAQDWIHLGHKHDLTLTRPSPGEYRLHIRGSNKDGVWSADRLALSMRVLPTWWQTRWVQALALGLLGTLAWAARTLLRSRARRRTLVLNREIRERKRAQSAAQKAQEAILSLLGVEGDEGSPDNRPPKWLREIRDRLDQAFDSPPTVGELAAAAHVHPDYLSRSFRRHFGIRIRSYVNQRRLEWARQQLESTRDSIADIGLAAGFSDQSHFSRAFKRHYRVTPTQYRNAPRIAPAGKSAKI